MIEFNDLIRKIKLARKYINDQEYQEAYNTLYLPPELEEDISSRVKPEVSLPSRITKEWLEDYKSKAEAVLVLGGDTISKNLATIILNLVKDIEARSN